MLTAIFSAIKIISTLCGFAQAFQAAIQHHAAVLDGEKQQALADDAATIQQATNAQKIDAAVSTESRAALIDELRGPGAGR